MLTVLFAAIHVLSLGIMLLFVHEYKRITLKHEQLLESIEQGKKPVSTFHSNMIIWVYIIVTMAIIGATSFYYYLVSTN